MNRNPFTSMFGKTPSIIVSRPTIVSRIATVFSSPLLANHVYVVKGTKGSGKTVLLTEIHDYFEEEGWIVVGLNPRRNVLEDLAFLLFERGKAKRLFSDFSLNLEVGESVSETSSAVERMLNCLKRKGKSLLITMDGIVTNEWVREFARVFQGFLQRGLPAFFIATGLHGNVTSLVNDKSFTFLYRAPKILLEPLNVLDISKSYEKALAIGPEEAMTLARLTKGYGFGYQLLGYLFYSKRKVDQDLLDEFDRQLRINAYDKIWASVSENERKILLALTRGEEVPVSEVMKETGFDNKPFSTYRERLLQKGVVVSKRRGFLSLALPRFDVFMANQ